MLGRNNLPSCRPCAGRPLVARRRPHRPVGFKFISFSELRAWDRSRAAGCHRRTHEHPSSIPGSDRPAALVRGECPRLLRPDRGVAAAGWTVESHLPDRDARHRLRAASQAIRCAAAERPRDRTGASRPEFLACCVATIIQVEAVLRGRSALFAWLAGFFVASAAGTAVRWLSLSAGLPWWFPFEGLGLCTLSFVLGLGCRGLHAVVRPRGAVGPRLKVKV